MARKTKTPGTVLLKYLAAAIAVLAVVAFLLPPLLCWWSYHLYIHTSDHGQYVPAKLGSSALIRGQYALAKVASSVLVKSGERAVPLLLEGLKSPEDSVRSSCAWTLGEIHRCPKRVVPALINALSDESEYVRDAASYALGRFGPDAGTAVPALIRVITHNPYPGPGWMPDMGGAWEAVLALGPHAVPELTKLLATADDEKTIHRVTEALGEMQAHLDRSS